MGSAVPRVGMPWLRALSINRVPSQVMTKPRAKAFRRRETGDTDLLEGIHPAPSLPQSLKVVDRFCERRVGCAFRAGL